MARLVWALLCQRSIVDKASNNLSVIDVVEDVQVRLRMEAGKPFTGVKLPMTVSQVSLWERSDLKKEEPEGRYQARIMSVDGKELGRLERSFAMTGANLRARTVLDIQNLPILKSGRYEVQIFNQAGKRWVRSAVLPINVTVSIEESAAEGN